MIRDAAPRLANLAIGIWLQVSAFAWPHTDAARISAWLPGLMISIVAVLSIGVPPLRWINGMLGLLLVGWTMTAADTELWAYWNGIIAGLWVLIFSSIPSKSMASDFVDS